MEEAFLEPFKGKNALLVHNAENEDLFKEDVGDIIRDIFRGVTVIRVESPTMANMLMAEYKNKLMIAVIDPTLDRAHMGITTALRALRAGIRNVILFGRQMPQPGEVGWNNPRITMVQAGEQHTDKLREIFNEILAQ